MITIENNVIWRVRKFLEEVGIAETFRYIKSLDTIELIGVSDNGGERVLLNDVMSEYGEDAVRNNCGFQYLIPCIPEGVIKSRTKNGVIYYTHFKLLHSTERDFGLEIKEYHFHDGDFYLRYIITIKGIDNMLNEDSYRETEVSYACIMQFLLKAFTKKELNKEFSKMEMDWILKTACADDANINRDVNIIIQYVLTTFQAINFLSNYKKMANDQEKRKRTSIIINEEENYKDGKKERIINVSKFYNLKPGNKVCESTNKPEKKIIRKTAKWIVSGHVRHYKSGKTVFVQAYYKGSNRDTNSKSQTTFRVKDTNAEVE